MIFRSPPGPPGLVAALTTLSIVIGCGRDATPPVEVATPPVIEFVSPAELPVSATAQSILLRGSGFAADAGVRLTAPDGSLHQTVHVSVDGDSLVDVTAVIASAGEWHLRVVNPGEVMSNEGTVTASMLTGGPWIQRVSPDRLTWSSTAQAVTLTGSGFSSDIHVDLRRPDGVQLPVESVNLVNDSTLQFNVVVQMSGRWTVQLRMQPVNVLSNQATFLATSEFEQPTGVCGGEHASIHAGPMDANETWSRASGPHIVVDSVFGGNLVVEAGAVVCGAEYSSLSPNQIVAIGTATEPVLFTSLGAGGWNGIRMAGTTGSSSMKFAVIERAGFGVLSDHNLTLEDTRILDSGTGISIRFGVVRRTIIERACTRASPPARPGDDGCAAINFPIGFLSGGLATSAAIEETQVRNSRAVGINVSMGAVATLRDVFIEGSAGTGLSVFASGGSSSTRLPNLTVVQPLRITGGASYPARVAWQHAGQLLGDSVSQSRLLGNARDTILIRHTGTPVASGGSETTGLITIRKELPWHVTAIGINGCGELGRVHMQPGAHLVVGAASSPCMITGTLTAAGTPDEPATIEAAGPGAPLFVRPAGDMPGLSHVRLKRIFLSVSGETVVQHATLDSSAIQLNGSARIADAHIRSTFPMSVTILPSVPATVTLASGTRMDRTTIELSARDAVLINGTGSVIEGCIVRGNMSHGIVAAATSSNSRITRCNIEQNDGLGILNRSTSLLDARNNWWGDAAGPLGPTGDGVQGNVLYDPFLAAPVPTWLQRAAARWQH